MARARSNLRADSVVSFERPAGPRRAAVQLLETLPTFLFPRRPLLLPQRLTVQPRRSQQCLRAKSVPTSSTDRTRRPQCPLPPKPFLIPIDPLGAFFNPNTTGQHQFSFTACQPSCIGHSFITRLAIPCAFLLCVLCARGLD